MSQTYSWHENYEVGKKFFQDNNYKEAKKLLEEVLKERHDFADIYNMLGLIYYDLDDIDKGIEMLEKATELNPRYTEAYLNLTVIFNDRGETERAKQVYRFAKESIGEADLGTYFDPNVKASLANMHFDLGNVYKSLGKYEMAIDEYKNALKLREDFVDIRVQLAVAYRDLKDFHHSVQELEIAIEKRPEYTNATIQMGLTYFAMERKDLALAQWQKVIHQHPHHKMANLYIQMIKK